MWRKRAVLDNQFLPSQNNTQLHLEKGCEERAKSLPHYTAMDEKLKKGVLDEKVVREIFQGSDDNVDKNKKQMSIDGN